MEQGGATAGQRVAFGIELGRHFDPSRLAAEAQQAEALGFDLFSISDHLHTSQPSYEPWTALTWIAAATTRITVVTNVLGLPYRAPAVMAKMAETLDRLSGGRLVFGLGVGGYDQEFAAFGMPARTPGEKVTALREAVEIIRGMWTHEAFSFSGEHFRTVEARIEPRPAHRIPIWLGTYGPRALRLTGVAADGWLPSLPRLTLEGASALRETVRASAQAAGRDPDEITCACNVVVHFGPASSPQVISGSSDAVAERLAAVIRAGFTKPIVTLRGPDERERFASEVIPLVRNEVNEPSAWPRGKG
jgi:probable F420-dependent oxidoreductase